MLFGIDVRGVATHVQAVGEAHAAALLDGADGRRWATQLVRRCAARRARRSLHVGDVSAIAEEAARAVRGEGEIVLNNATQH